MKATVVNGSNVKLALLVLPLLAVQACSSSGGYRVASVGDVAGGGDTGGGSGGGTGGGGTGSGSGGTGNGTGSGGSDTDSGGTGSGSGNSSSGSGSQLGAGLISSM